MTNHLRFWAILVPVACLLVALFGVQTQPSYVGAKTCGMCHKAEKQGRQFQIWEESLHAQAFRVLQSDEAKKIAKERGLGESPDKSAACLKCHATGYDVDKSLRGVGFRIEDGVQCETCHGAGSAYKTLKIMKDPELAKQNGLVFHTEGEKFCVGCHNAESPTFASFDFEKMWARIAHPVPST